MSNKPPLRHADGFLSEVAIGSPKSAQTYATGLRALALWLQHMSDNPFYGPHVPWPLNPAFLDTGQIVAFKLWLLENKRKTTAATYTMAVVGYLTYLEGVDALPDAVQLGKVKRQIKRRSRGYKPAQQMVVSLDIPRQRMPEIVSYYMSAPLPPPDSYGRHLSALRNRALTQLMMASAARISEIRALDRGQVDAGQNQIMIIGKKQRARTLHLDRQATDAIAAYLDQRTDNQQALFVSHSRNSANDRINIASIGAVVKRAIRALEMDDRLSAHDFRHYRASQLLRAGVPLEVVQEYLGHADISTTRNTYAPLLGANHVGGWLEKVGR